MQARAVVFLAAAALVVLPPAEGQSTSGQGRGDVTLNPTQQLHPLPTPLARGDALAFDWRVTEPAGAPLFFSTHMHLGAQQLNLTESEATARADRLIADRDGQYSILWENRGADIITFHYEYHTEKAAAAPAKTPLPAALALLALAGAAPLAGRR